jgi:PleD family two-component response regulator
MNPNGTGLGLYICKLLCQALGGNIKCISEPNKNTEFSFYVRAKASKTKKEQKPLATQAPLTLIDRKPADNYTVRIQPIGPMILAAEDLAFNRFAIKHVFKAELGLFENQFLIVEDGKQAVEEVVKQAFSLDKLKLVLLDYNMPKYNGLEALGWI